MGYSDQRVRGFKGRDAMNVSLQCCSALDCITGYSRLDCYFLDQPCHDKRKGCRHCFFFDFVSLILFLSSINPGP